MNEFVMERRPHWDFDLVEAVKAASTKYGAGTVDSAYAVIAAVEDWRNSNIQVHWQGMTATERNLSEALGREQHGRDELEAAIKRVQELHEDYFHDRSDLDAVESLEAIGRALDGLQ